MSERLIPNDKPVRNPLVLAIGRGKLSRNTVILIVSIILTACIIYTSVRSYHGVMNETLPIVSYKLQTKYAALTSKLDKYQRMSGVIPPDVNSLLMGYGVDLYTLISGDTRFSGEASDLVRDYGEVLRMLSPSYQAILFCSTYRDKCKDMLSFITNDISSRMF